MANFADNLDALDGAVRDTLCDDAVYFPRQGGSVPGVRVQIDKPADEDRLQGSTIVRAKPVISVSVQQVPSLLQGETFVVAGERWKVAGAPTRPGDGRWWVADVQAVAL